MVRHRDGGCEPDVRTVDHVLRGRSCMGRAGLKERAAGRPCVPGGPVQCRLFHGGAAHEDACYPM